MRYVIVGYGKMGQEIEKILQKQKLDSYETIDPDSIGPIHLHHLSLKDFINGDEFFNEYFKDTVFIDFTQPDQALQNIQLYAKNKANAVIGTTGWYNHLPKVKKLVKDSEIGLVYGTNFSTSVQKMFYLNNILARLTAGDDYDVTINEVHHNAKKDVSGTANTLAKDIIAAPNSIKSEAIYGINGAKGKHQLTISSDRLVGVFGEHTVRYANEFNGDTIAISHRAGGRTAFAQGAIDAAGFINGKSGIFDWSNVLRDRFNNQLSK
ncbi:MAG: 4-hydroxy-tetrahydrodipicolinate reductase [Alphaproteobacteria bacterium]|nr:4-hydroxy-tetrahydrodipicolinate reductase [Alphaproteobacteria bacterium]